MKLRKLQANEVTFITKVEPEEMPIEGNFIDSGDNEVDRAAEKELADRVNRGDMRAWCCLRVTACWNHHEAGHIVGGFSFAEDDEEGICDAFEELKVEALESLNESLQQLARDLSTLRVREVPRQQSQGRKHSG